LFYPFFIFVASLHSLSFIGFQSRFVAFFMGCLHDPANSQQMYSKYTC